MVLDLVALPLRIGSVAFQRASFDPLLCKSIAADFPDGNARKLNSSTVGWQSKDPMVFPYGLPSSHYFAPICGCEGIEDMEPTIDEHRSQCCCQFLKCGTRCDFESSADEDKILRQNFIDYVEVVWRIPKLLPESKNELDRGVWVQVRLPICHRRSKNDPLAPK